MRERKSTPVENPAMSTTSGLVGNPTEAVPASNGTAHKITPMRAGSMGAAFGLGVGLLLGELIVPGIVIAAAAAVGIAAMRSRACKAEKA
jgi:hypothetical protein